MKNCIIAQSGGPTAVINASAVGIYEKNLDQKYFDKVFFGINGIEGILNNNILDSSTLNHDEILALKFTPSSALGSCRYKLDNYTKNSYDYDKVIDIFTALEIDTFFYIGGNDSMDTVLKFSKYCANTSCKIKFIGIPKTIDNDLIGTDHSPGFGSAAKLISTIVLETYLDSSVYKNNGIFILETMGRDTGWLAASSALATINNKPVVDLIFLPELPFDRCTFLNTVRSLYKKNNKVYIVVSEGVKTIDGNFLSKQSTLSHDTFGHSQLGGASVALKNMIIDAGITSHVKTLELGIIQRCAMHCSSTIDIEEATAVGAYGIELSKKGFTGVMATINRISDIPYSYKISHTNIQSIANKTKYFPLEWISENGTHITSTALAYLSPLIAGNTELSYTNGLPSFIKL